MRLRELSILFAACWLNHAMGQPPLTVEWVAMLPFGSGEVWIDRDNVTGRYLWAVDQEFLDELICSFDSSGNDLSSASGEYFNVGSLDHLRDIEVIDGNRCYIMHHQNIAGDPQDIFWHLFAGSGEEIFESGSDSIHDYANDLCADGGDLFIGGVSDITSAPFWNGRVIRADTSATISWDMSWNDGTLASSGFLAVAAHGDTIVAAAFPLVVLFARANGAYIDQLALFSGDPASHRSGHVIEHDGILHWAVGMDSTLYYGAWDLESGAIWSGDTTFTTTAATVDVVVDDEGHTWIGCTADNAGQVLRINQGGTLLGTYPTYARVTDLEWALGRLCITGQLAPDDPTTYIVTGIPIP